MWSNTVVMSVDTCSQSKLNFSKIKRKLKKLNRWSKVQADVAPHPSSKAAATTSRGRPFG